MKTLLIIDIQNDFLPGGSLAVKDGDAIIPVLNELMPHFDHIVATQDYHPSDHESFAVNHVGKNVGEMIELAGQPQILWPTHCVQGTQGADFAEELQTQRFNIVFRKGTDSHIDSYSGFYDNGHLKSTGLAEYLKEIGTSELHLVGLATDYCVKFTALDAINEGFKTSLILDAVRGVNIQPGDCDCAIQEMKNAGVYMITSDDLLGETITLYRPTGPEELALVEQSRWKAWPPRLPEQPIFYPVLNQTYAEQIAQEWNVPASGCGYVTRFDVKRSFLKSYQRKVVGGKAHEEFWIPAEDLEALNENIVNYIEVVKKYER
jgi:nicotinamidase/pyrazinamidase